MKTITIVFKTVLSFGGLVAATAGGAMLPSAISTGSENVLPLVGFIVGGGFLCAAGASEFLQYRNRMRHDHCITRRIQSRYE